MIKPGECHIKNAAVFMALIEYRYEPLLIEIEEFIIKKYGAVITESYRPRKHSNDLHGTIPVRALDNRSWCYPGDMVYRVAKSVNERWQYDHNRPKMKVAFVHSNRKGKGVHIHLQVHPNTRIRNYL
jgi:hypothetical protein